MCTLVNFVMLLACLSKLRCSLLRKVELKSATFSLSPLPPFHLHYARVIARLAATNLCPPAFRSFTTPMHTYSLTASLPGTAYLFRSLSSSAYFLFTYCCCCSCCLCCCMLVSLLFCAIVKDFILRLCFGEMYLARPLVDPLLLAFVAHTRAHTYYILLFAIHIFMHICL